MTWRSVPWSQRVLFVGVLLGAEDIETYIQRVALTLTHAGHHAYASG